MENGFRRDLRNYPLLFSVVDSVGPLLFQPRPHSNSHRMRGIDDLRKVKAGQGPDIVLWGSSTLYLQAFEEDLIDRFMLLIRPIFIGKG